MLCGTSELTEAQTRHPRGQVLLPFLFQDGLPSAGPQELFSSSYMHLKGYGPLALERIQRSPRSGIPPPLFPSPHRTGTGPSFRAQWPTAGAGGWEEMWPRAGGHSPVPCLGCLSFSLLQKRKLLSGNDQTNSLRRVFTALFWQARSFSIYCPYFKIKELCKTSWLKHRGEREGEANKGEIRSKYSKIICLFYTMHPTKICDVELRIALKSI